MEPNIEERTIAQDAELLISGKLREWKVRRTASLMTEKANAKRRWEEQESLITKEIERVEKLDHIEDFGDATCEMRKY